MGMIVNKNNFLLKNKHRSGDSQIGHGVRKDNTSLVYILGMNTYKYNFTSK